MQEWWGDSVLGLARFAEHIVDPVTNPFMAEYDHVAGFAHSNADTSLYRLFRQSRLTQALRQSGQSNRVPRSPFAEVGKAQAGVGCAEECH